MQECIDTELIKQAKETAACLIEKLKTFCITVSLAESCTAGLISDLLAHVPGASSVLWGSFVCYTKEAKVSMLGIESNKLDKYGLVSKETANSMAIAALQKSGADAAAAVTGLAGPAGDGSDVPVGTVWTAVALKNGETKVKMFNFAGSRNEIRIRAAIAVLDEISEVFPATS